MTGIKKTTWVIVILLLCFGIRVIYASILTRRLNELVVADMRTYDLLAVNLIEKGYYGIEAPWSYRPPLYPFFLSLIYRLFGHSYIIARIIQAGLAALSCLLLFYIARDLGGFRVALLAVFLAALDFSLIHLSGLFLSENLYIPLSLLLIWLLLKGFRNPKVLTFVGAGIAGGLAALCRPTILPFLFLSFLAPVIKRVAATFRLRKGIRRLPSASLPSTPLRVFDRVYEKSATTSLQEPANGRCSIGRGLAGWLLMLLFAALTISPWTARNYRIHHAFVPISTNAGPMLWMGLHHGASGGYDWPREDNPLLAVSDEVERNRIGIRESIKFIFNHSGEFVKLALLKMKFFWRGYLFTWSGRQWALIGLAGLGGLLLSLKEWRKWLLLYIYLLSFTGLHLFVHSSYRYRLPLNPLMEIWAAVFLVRIYNTMRKKWQHHQKIDSG